MYLEVEINIKFYQKYCKNDIYINHEPIFAIDF